VAEKDSCRLRGKVSVDENGWTGKYGGSYSQFCHYILGQYTFWVVNDVVVVKSTMRSFDVLRQEAQTMAGPSEASISIRVLSRSADAYTPDQPIMVLDLLRRGQEM